MGKAVALGIGEEGNRSLIRKAAWCFPLRGIGGKGCRLELVRKAVEAIRTEQEIAQFLMGFEVVLVGLKGEDDAVFFND